MARLIDKGVTKVAWVEDLVAPNAPKVAELNAGTDITDLLLSSYSLGFEDSDTISERSIAETENSSTITVGNYAGQLELFRSFTALGAVDADDPSEIFEEESVGYIVRRFGLPHDTAWAAAQTVEVYRVQVDKLKTSNGEGYLKASAKLLPQGFATTKAVVASV